MALTSRERVLAAIHHEEPDRVPIVLGASNATTMKMAPYRHLKGLLGIQADDRYLYDWPELGSAALDDATLSRLRSDVRGVHDRFPAVIYERNQNRSPGSMSIDDWGIGRIEIQPGVWFPGVHPLENVTNPAALQHYPWPDMDDPTRVSHVRQQAERLAMKNQYAIFAAPWLLFPLERAMDLQGMENFLQNIALHHDFAQELLQKIASLCKTLMGNFLNQLGENVDIIKIGDDLGMQDRLLISPRMYRDLIKPIHADYIAFIKAHTKAKVFFHTDGDVFDLLDDFVEIGIDILNPIQTSAGKMADLSALKSRYGKNLCFCGAIDTQSILSRGTPAQVRQEVRRVIEQLSPGGGYLLAAVHTITADVPAKNILAMVDAAQEFGRYP